MGKKNSNMPQMHDKIEQIIGTGVANKNAFYEALAAYMEFKSALDCWGKTIRAFSKDAAKVCEMVSKYAIAHTSVFKSEDGEGGLTEAREGVLSGDVAYDGVTYHLSVSRDKPQRVDGSAMTQEFIKTLPEDWVKSKLEPIVSVVNKINDETLANYGLECPDKCTWSYATEA